ncbi:MAG: RHS repeat-associated core domain-containing protein [Bryobacteraceae bacterium]
MNGGTQTTGGQDYSFLAALKPFVGIDWIQYPNTGRKVTTVYDSAGRPLSLSGQVGTAAPYTYASAASYAPHGAMQSLTLGNTLIEATCYNERLQVTARRLGSSATTNCAAGVNDPLRLSFTYSATQNNGNVLTQTTSRYLGGSALSWTQSYGYDAVNRLTTASETGAGSWSQTNGFDVRGNRWVAASTGLPGVTNETPQGSTWFTSTDNRVTAPSAWTYDGAGNVMAIGGMQRSFTYDAENRQKTAVINSQTTTYTYDGDGRRVTKAAPSGTTVFVYDPFGNLAQEYGPSTDSGTKYITADHLGSTRLVTDSAGAVSKCYDYLPFGEELGNGTAGRTNTCFGSATYPSAADKISDKFTSKERDAETGLDYFGARYMSSAQGRFTSPDEFTGGAVDPFTGQQIGQPGPLPYADITNPQSLNKYAYVVNNPLRYTDPDGHCPWCIGALVGGGMDVGIQMIEGKSFSEIDWVSVGISAGAGAVGGGIAAKTAELAWGLKLAIEGGVDAAGSAAQQLHKNGTVSGTETAIDVVAGRVVGGVVSGAVESAVKNSPAVKQILKEADRKTRIGAAAEAAGNASSAARRSAQAGALNSQASSIVYGRATAASTAASQAASEAAKKTAERQRKKKEEEGQ